MEILLSHPEERKDAMHKQAARETISTSEGKLQRECKYHMMPLTCGTKLRRWHKQPVCKTEAILRHRRQTWCIKQGRNREDWGFEG